MTLALILTLAPLLGPASLPPGPSAPPWPAAGWAEGPEDLRGALAGLGAETASERLDSQRWLAARLETEDLPLVAEFAAGAGLEIRTRLIAALGADDRHLGLAALLATDRDSSLRLVGRSAVRKMILRWHGEDTLSPRPMENVEKALEGRFGGQLFSLDLNAVGTDVAVDLIARHLGTPIGIPQGALGIAVNPVLYTQSVVGRDPGGPDSGRPLGGVPEVGAGNELLFAVLRERGLTIEAYAFDSPRAWLHVVDPAGAGIRSGDDLLGRWVREAADPTSRTRGAGAARALAGSGWPAALAWLEERWLEHRDVNALSGLLLAAGRGRVAPGLARVEMVEYLLAEGDSLLAGLAPPSGAPAGPLTGLAADRARLRLAELTRALASVGPVGTDGADLSQVVAAGWDDATAAQRNFRMGVLAGMGGAPEALLRKLGAWLGESRGGPSDLEGYGAVRLLAAVDFARAQRPAPLPIAHVDRLFELARATGSLDAFDGWLRRAGGVPPPSWATPAGLPESMSASLRARVLLWLLDSEGPSASARQHLLVLTTSAAQGPEGQEGEVGAVLHARTMAGGAPQLQALFAATAADLDPGGVLRLQRLALLAGILDEGLHIDFAERLLSGGPLAPGDLLLVGALCSGPAGDIVRPALYAAVQADASNPRGLGLDAAWVPAVERAINDLSRANRTRTEKVLQRDLRKLLLGTRHPLVGGLQDDSWPRPPGARVEALEAQDWRLEL